MYVVCQKKTYVFAFFAGAHVFTVDVVYLRACVDAAEPRGRLAVPEPDAPVRGAPSGGEDAVLVRAPGDCLHRRGVLAEP